MPRFLVKLKDLYFEWSTIVDAPVSYGRTLEELKEWHAEKYPGENVDPRLERVEKYGTSSLDPQTPEELMGFNRAGKNETCLTLDEIYEAIKPERG